MRRRLARAGAVLAAAALVVAAASGGLRAEGAAGEEAEGAAGEGAEAAEAAEAAPEEVAAAGPRGPVTSLPLPRFVSLRAETANARRGPSLSHRVDWEFRRRGWPLQITAEYGHWRRVRDVEGAGGWVHHSLLSGMRMAVFVGDGLVPLHVTRSDISAVRAYAQPGVVARLDRCAEDWCRLAVEGTDGWVRRRFLWGID